MRVAFLQRFTNIRREEVAPALVAGLFFFCVLTALMVARPAREALGMQRGIEALRWLFMGTVLATIDDLPMLNRLQERAYAACVDQFDWRRRGESFINQTAAL